MAAIGIVVLKRKFAAFVNSVIAFRGSLCPGCRKKFDETVATPEVRLWDKRLTIKVEETQNNGGEKW